MGGRGTDVAREAASLVLLDDDFTSLVAAVRLGRRIDDNLRKAISYVLAVHVPIAGTPTSSSRSVAPRASRSSRPPDCSSSSTSTCSATRAPSTTRT